MDLSPKIPQGSQYSALHIRTNAYQCKPLTISRKKPLTLKVRHLLLLSEKDTSRIVLGIEIYVYLTFQGSLLERHIFISKADTTGLGSRHISTASMTKTFLEYLIDLDPKVYLDGAKYRRKARVASLEDEKYDDTAHNDPLLKENACELEIVKELRALSKKLRRDPSTLENFYKDGIGSSKPALSQLPVKMPITSNTRISLFTRSADAYLFPNSEKNKGKHRVDGNTLFKWWISILDNILNDTWSCKADIPGSDRVSVSKFIPRKDHWSIGNIYVSRQSTNRAVHTIPLFPDDPKGRFLEHLIVENRYKSVDTNQFWDELGFRQEFRLGNVVGMIGCSTESSKINGILEDHQTTIVSPKQYKKLRELIKSEDYANADDISNLWCSGVSELATRFGAKLHYISILGSMDPKINGDKSGSKNMPTVVNTVSVKKTAQPVNNLSGLVKRRKNILSRCLSDPLDEVRQHLSEDIAIHSAESDQDLNSNDAENSENTSEDSSIDADMENSDSSQSNLVSDRTLIDEDRPAHSPNVTARTTYAIAANEKTQKTTKTSENQKTQKTSENQKTQKTSENQNPKKITPGAGSKSSLQYEKAVRAEIERAEAEDKRNVGYLTKSIRDSLVGDDFAYARNAIDRFAQSQPIESQLMHLVDFPINTHSLKLDLINPNELSHARILEILKEWSKSRTEKCFKDCERIIDTINYATMKLEEFNSDFVEGSGDRERFDVISTLQEAE
ncbi:hypothetical protein JCM33374_g3663 [Metschnikowia sp. JCM 33374]|nr:hypothetical protein JCM33374_g3663 [Metschnikowia sp. JCM 33374]